MTLMIPKGWQFKGWVNVGVDEGGYFGDWFSVVGDAPSRDMNLELLEERRFDRGMVFRHGVGVACW
jgi:hypothetical protein